MVTLGYASVRAASLTETHAGIPRPEACWIVLVLDLDSHWVSTACWESYAGYFEQHCPDADNIRDAVESS